jgi:hypothetical protein
MMAGAEAKVGVMAKQFLMGDLLFGDTLLELGLQKLKNIF